MGWFSKKKPVADFSDYISYEMAMKDCAVPFSGDEKEAIQLGLRILRGDRVDPVTMHPDAAMAFKAVTAGALTGYARFLIENDPVESKDAITSALEHAYSVYPHLPVLDTLSGYYRTRGLMEDQQLILKRMIRDKDSKPPYSDFFTGISEGTRAELTLMNKFD